MNVLEQMVLPINLLKRFTILKIHIIHIMTSCSFILSTIPKRIKIHRQYYVNKNYTFVVYHLSGAHHVGEYENRVLGKITCENVE